MNKRLVLIAITVCIFVSGVILVNDYYRARLVSAELDLGSSNEIFHEENNPVENEAEEDEKKHASVVIFGDNLIHESVLNYANLLAGGEGKKESYNVGFDFQPIYGELRQIIEEADLSICNQSSLVGANDRSTMLSGYPLFNSPTDLGYDLIDIGFDVINIANNHLLDMSDLGYQRSSEFWESAGVFLSGGYTEKSDAFSAEDHILEINGIRVGILSYMEGTNGLQVKNENTVLPSYLFRESVVLKEKLWNEISAVKANSDITLVLLNWGYNAGYEASDEQRDVAKQIAAAGADLIIGTGPKVIQTIETIKDSANDRETVCVYSLGNMMGTMKYMDNLLGGFFRFEVRKDEDGVKLENMSFTPTVIHYDENVSQIKVYPLSKYNDSLFMVHGSNCLYGFGTFDWYQETVEKFIPKKYLVN